VQGDVARATAAGLDPKYGSNGLTIFDFGGLAISAAARANTDGTAMTTFGQAGKQTALAVWRFWL
jgi:hypothetical protein